MSDVDARDSDSGRNAAIGQSGILLDWSANARALLVQATPLAAALPWAGRLGALLRDPSLQPYFDRPMIETLQVVVYAYSVVTALLTGWFFYLRRRNPESTVFVFVALAFLSIWLGGASHLLGTFSSPMLGAVLAASSAISIFFLPRFAIPGMVMIAFCYFAPVVFVVVADVPYAPLFASDPVVDHRPDVLWITSYAFFSFAILVLPLGIQMAVLARWRKRDELVHRLACFDALTGVANRRHFFELAEHEVARSSRYGSTTGLVLVDVDHFKAVNDRYGHHVGDEALRHVASVLSMAVKRKVDVVGRYGGEEFAILAPETDLDGAATVAENCRRALESSPLERPIGGPIRITASFGVASFDPDDPTFDGLIRRADDALYRAKNSGRNRVERSTPS